MDPLKWLRAKPKPAPPALQFEIAIANLPLACQDSIQAGAKCTVRQYPAKQTGKRKFRSRCDVFLDGKFVAETEVTWEEDPPK